MNILPNTFFTVSKLGDARGVRVTHDGQREQDYQDQGSARIHDGEDNVFCLIFLFFDGMMIMFRFMD